MNIYVNPILMVFSISFFIVIFNLVYLFGVEKGRKWSLEIVKNIIEKELKGKK